MKIIRNLDSISFAGGSAVMVVVMAVSSGCGPIAYALGFIDCENISARCMLTIFQLFAARTEASILRMLEGSPHVSAQAYPGISGAREAKIHTRRRVREDTIVVRELKRSYWAGSCQR